MMTSYDDFDVANSEVLSQFDQIEREGDLKVNGQPVTRNPFGRKQVFLSSSFNDWVPYEMKTCFEIKTEEE